MPNLTYTHRKFRRFLKLAKGFLRLVLLVLEILNKIADLLKDSH